jgi:hypothetical protein
MAAKFDYTREWKNILPHKWMCQCRKWEFLVLG